MKKVIYRRYFLKKKRKKVPDEAHSKRSIIEKRLNVLKQLNQNMYIQLITN